MYTMNKGKLIGIAVAIAIAAIVGVSLAFSATPPKSPQGPHLNVTETPHGRNLTLNLEEKVGVKANP